MNHHHHHQPDGWKWGAEIVGWDGVRHGLWLRGMGADSELRFVIMAGAAGIARRNSAWGCS